jgi:hypothetical protein
MGIENTVYDPTPRAASKIKRSPMRLLPPAPVIPSQKTRPTPTNERATPRTPLQVGLSNPSANPSRSPHTGAVAKIRPVLAAVVMLTPKVKAVWPIATPRHPKPTIGRKSFGTSLPLGSRMRKTQSIRRPPTVKRMATIKRGGTNSAANLVAA